MEVRPIITSNQKVKYSDAVTHLMQSWQWGDFRKKMGQTVLRFGMYEGQALKSAFQISLHPIPFTRYFVGYIPKGPFPSEDLAKALKVIGKKYSCAFIKIEPDIEAAGSRQQATGFRKSPKSLFTKFNFVIDLNKSEEELLKDMHPKTRYNIGVAQKHHVRIEQGVSNEDFETYLKLYFETTKRQGYHGHDENYHQEFWKLFKAAKMARILIAYWKVPPTFEKTPLAAWMLVNFKDTLYYPYGGSTTENRQVMANNLLAWEAIRMGKKLGLKTFDMWGALGPDADPNDPWFGFHNFKKGYGGRLVEYMGTYDLVFNWPIYILFTFIDKLMPLKVFLLKLLKR
jgi:lipid II:glycine glycyltransferase (peptidoglycan interpeptide bridge formation enzyme)